MDVSFDLIKKIIMNHLDNKLTELNKPEDSEQKKEWNKPLINNLTNVRNTETGGTGGGDYSFDDDQS